MRNGWIIGLAVVVGSVLPAAATTSAERCQAAKLREAGKYDLCRLKAEAKAIQRGSAPDYARCQSLLASRWQHAEERAGGACPTTGDATAIATLLAQQADTVATALAGGGLPTCEADLATCEADLAVALACGNGVVDAGEACDQAALNGASCGGLGFAGGTLRCASNCQLDADGCWSARFVDNADGTISDRQSGLMWEKKVGLDYTVNFADPHDADNMYFWAGRCSANIDKYCQPTAASAALCAAVATAGTEGCTLCDAGEGVCDQSGTVWDALVQLNAAGFAGHADWRLPSREELASMIDYSGAAYPSVDPAFHGTGCGATCAELADPACSCTRTFYYWSASSPLSVPPFAWLVDGGDGTQSQAVKIFDLHTRAVRGGF